MQVDYALTSNDDYTQCFFFNLAQLVNLFTLDGTVHLAAINTINVKEKKKRSIMDDSVSTLWFVFRNPSHLSSVAVAIGQK